MLSAAELQAALKDLLRFEMTTDEVKTMHEFFRAKFRRPEVKRAEFAELINKQPVRKYESKGAKAALAAIRNQLRKSGRSIESVLATQKTTEFPGEICLRGFKLSVYSLGCLTQQQVNNLAKYLDKRNNGMIQFSDINLALNTDQYSPATV